MFSLQPPTRAHTFILIFTKPPSSPFPCTHTHTHRAHKITNGAYSFGRLWTNRAISSCSEQHSDIMSRNKNTHQYSAIIYFIPGINTGLNVLKVTFASHPSTWSNPLVPVCYLLLILYVWSVGTQNTLGSLLIIRGVFSTSWRERGLKKRGPEMFGGFFYFRL